MICDKRHKKNEIIFGVLLGSTICIFFAIILLYILFYDFGDLIQRIQQDYVKTALNFLGFLLYLCIILIGIIFSFNKITTKHPETKIGLKYISFIIFFSLIAVYLTFTMSDKDYQTSIALFISTLFLGIGWWVQAIITQVAQRRSHTITTIMNQRNNSQFIEKVENIRDTIGLKIINEEFIKYYFEHKIRNTNKKSIKKQSDLKDEENQEFDKTIKAIDDLTYILNYYEFIAAGVNSKDLDEKLIIKCFKQVLINLEKRAYHYICICLEDHMGNDDYPLKELGILINRISNDSLILKIKQNKEKIKPFGSHEYVYSDEEIKKFFNKEYT